MPRDKRSESLGDGQLVAGRVGILPELPAEECPMGVAPTRARSHHGRVGPVTREDA